MDAAEIMQKEEDIVFHKTRHLSNSTVKKSLADRETQYEPR